MTVRELFRTRPSKERVTIEDERALIEAAQRPGFESAKAQMELLAQYRGMLQEVSYRVRSRAPGMTAEQIDDLESDLIMAALDAIKAFNLVTHIRLAQTLKPALTERAGRMESALAVPKDTLKLWFKILRAAGGDVQAAALEAPALKMSTDTFRAIHLALDHSETEWSQVPYDAGRAVPDELTHSLVHSALAALKPADRLVMELAYGFKGDPKTDAEVAEITGLSRDAVKKTRQRTLAKMKAGMAGATE